VTIPHPPKRYLLKPSNQYERDIRRLVKAGADLTKLDEVIDLLVDGEKLPERCRDHSLKGRLAGIRECHVAPDWLLLYAKDDMQLVLLLVRTGTHRDALGVE
jgi:mRNA interferase YafQ